VVIAAPNRRAPRSFGPASAPSVLAADAIPAGEQAHGADALVANQQPRRRTKAAARAYDVKPDAVRLPHHPGDSGQPVAAQELARAEDGRPPVAVPSRIRLSGTVGGCVSSWRSTR
jgi:hypothetical protein